MMSSVPAVPITVEPFRGSGLIETVAEEMPNVRRSAAQHHNQDSNSSAAPLASVDSSDFANFFSPVKAAVKEETLAESCEVTKRVNRYLQKVENQTPAPRAWSSLPGTSASLGTSVVEVKKNNLELIKSETLFVPDQSY